jgi:5-bromo-4-chloroindolyl phosphate hydrolysis protein
MNNVRGLDLLIRYFAWGALIGGLILLTAVVLALFHKTSVGLSVAIGSAGLLTAATSLREVQRGRRMRAKRTPVVTNVKSMDLFIRYFSWGAFIGGVIVLAAVVLALLHEISGGWSLAIGFAGLLLAAMSIREVQRGRRMRAKRIQSEEL